MSLKLQIRGHHRLTEQNLSQAIPLAPPPPEPPLVAPAASTAIATPSTFSRLLTTILSFSTLIIKSPLEFVANAYLLIKTWWSNLGPELTPIQQVTQFGANFNKSYDAKVFLIVN